MQMYALRGICAQYPCWGEDSAKRYVSEMESGDKSFLRFPLKLAELISCISVYGCLFIAGM